MIRVVTDGMPRVRRGANVCVWHEHVYREFARARMYLSDDRQDGFEMYLDDAGNLDIREIRNGIIRTIYSSTAAERTAPCTTSHGTPEQPVATFPPKLTTQETS